MDQNWAIVLNCLYNAEDDWTYFGRGDKGITRDHPLIEKTGLSQSDIQAGITFLERNELIEEDNQDSFRLTPKGFDVARQREIQEKQVDINRTIVVFTAVIAFAALAQTIDILINHGAGQPILFLIGTVIGALFAYTVTTLDRL